MKNLIQDPFWGTKVSWSPRTTASSLVKIENRLRVWNAAHDADDVVPCTLVVPRLLLRKLLPKQTSHGKPGRLLSEFRLLSPPAYTEGLYTLAIDCSITLWKLVRHGPPTQKSTISVEVTPFPTTRLRFPRIYLPVVSRFFAIDTAALPSRVPNLTALFVDVANFGHEETYPFEEQIRARPFLWEAVHSIDPAPPWKHLAMLTKDLYLWFLPLRSLLQAAYPPRGTPKPVFPSSADISAALCVCKSLVDAIVRQIPKGKDNMFKDELRTIIKGDSELYTYCKHYDYSPSALIVALVQRRFRHFQQGIAKVDLLQDTPETVLRRYNDKKQFELFVDEEYNLFKRDPLVAIAVVNAWLNQTT